MKNVFNLENAVVAIDTNVIFPPTPISPVVPKTPTEHRTYFHGHPRDVITYLDSRTKKRQVCFMINDFLEQHSEAYLDFLSATMNINSNLYLPIIVRDEVLNQEEKRKQGGLGKRTLDCALKGNAHTRENIFEKMRESVESISERKVAHYDPRGSFSPLIPTIEAYLSQINSKAGINDILIYLSVCQKAEEQGKRAVILSDDRDMHQIRRVSEDVAKQLNTPIPNITVMYPSRLWHNYHRRTIASA